MTYPPQQPPGNWGGQQPYDPAQQQGYDQQSPFGQQPQSYDLEPAANPYSSPPADPYSAPPADPYAPQQPAYDPTQYSAPPVSAAPASPGPYPGAPMVATPPPKNGPPAWIFIIGGVVVLALIGVVVLFVVNATSGDDDKPDNDTAQSSDAPSDDPTSDAPPPDDLVKDENTGLGFKAVSSWITLDPSRGSPVPGFTTFAGQQYEVSSKWVAMMGVGEIDTSAAGYQDSGDLKDTVKLIAEAYDNNNFGEDPKGLKRDKEPEYSDDQLAGKEAITMAYHLTWDAGENPDTGEQIVLAVIDLGDGRAAGFLGSIPDSTPSSEVDAAVEAVKTLAFA